MLYSNSGDRAKYMYQYNWKSPIKCGIKERLFFAPDSYMEVIKTLRPGYRGTARLLRKYGERLVCVRYRFDPERNKHVTTVEIVVDERDATGEHVSSGDQIPISQKSVVVRIDLHETELRDQAKQANGIWDPERRGWVLPYTTVLRLGLQ